MAKVGFAQKIKQFFSGRSVETDEVFDDLTDALIESDISASDAFAFSSELQKSCRAKRLQEYDEIVAELRRIVGSEVREIHFSPDPAKTTIFLLLGVNGVGKTTSCAKLASFYAAGGFPREKIAFAAADTFRAAAIEQLKFHAEKLGVRVVAHQHGSDPGAVVFDAAESVKARGGGLVIADTAGRLHNKENLVNELKKIDRIAETKSDECRRILVLDGTTGQNAVRQVEAFGAAVKLDAVFLTKYDSSARGGIAVSIGKQFSLPVCFLGFGETNADISPFDAEKYVKGFFE